jgi:hypothetical protein
MSKNINLAGKIEKVGFPHEKALLLRKIALITALTTGALAFLVFLASVQFSLSSALAEQEKVNSQLFGYQKSIGQARLLKDRINQIKSINLIRIEKFSKVEKVVEKKPQGVELSSVNLEENSIIITFVSSSLQLMNSLVDSLETVKFDPSEKVKISELKLNPNLGYSLSVTIE